MSKVGDILRAALKLDSNNFRLRVYKGNAVSVHRAGHTKKLKLLCWKTVLYLLFPASCVACRLQQGKFARMEIFEIEETGVAERTEDLKKNEKIKVNLINAAKKKT